MSALLQMRRAQRRFVQLVDKHRLLAFLARRQFGKTTTFARIALKKMMKQRDHTVIFGSAKLNLSREIVRKEAQILQAAIREAIEQSGKKELAGMLRVYDATTHRAPDKLTADDFAEMFEAQRLEFRFYHDRGSYSRTKVVALLPDTVGETGDLMGDEIGRVKNWREVWEAISPIVASNPQFRICLSTTPPPDDGHFSFDMLAPPVGVDFKPNPEGNLYTSDMGVTVLRVDAWDAFADGVPVYDLATGDALSPDESRRREPDKDAWDRNYGCKFVIGGTSACGLIQLDTAQRRGVESCVFVNVSCDEDFDRALEGLKRVLGPGKVGIGIDTATTTAGTSNPTSVSVVEQVGVDFIIRLVMVWKTADPEIADDRFIRTIKVVNKRSAGGRARRVCVDATNERYYAIKLRRKLTPLAPTELVVASTTVDKSGYGPQTMKQLLGMQLIGSLDDNHLTMPADRYVREDWRLVKKEKGMLTCTPDSEGRHGDTFDSSKLGLHALTSKAGVAQIDLNVEMSGGGMLKPKHRDPRRRETWIDDNSPRGRHMAV